MKKTFFLMLLLPMVVVSSAFAGSKDGENEKALSSFKKEFSTAEDVKWETGRELSKASFKLNNHVMFAYYAANGEMVAVTRNISSSLLPINLVTELKKDYSTDWITDLFELANTNGTAYYITLENADYTTILKSVNGGGWQTYRKTKKA